jgi:hypothetical protein
MKLTSFNATQPALILLSRTRLRMLPRLLNPSARSSAFKSRRLNATSIRVRRSIRRSKTFKRLLGKRLILVSITQVRIRLALLWLYTLTPSYHVCFKGIALWKSSIHMNDSELLFSPRPYFYTMGHAQSLLNSRQASSKTSSKPTPSDPTTSPAPSCAHGSTSPSPSLPPNLPSRPPPTIDLNPARTSRGNRSCSSPVSRGWWL